MNSLRERQREREHAFIKIVPFDSSEHPQETIHFHCCNFHLLSFSSIYCLLSFAHSFVKTCFSFFFFFYLSRTLSSIPLERTSPHLKLGNWEGSMRINISRFRNKSRIRDISSMASVPRVVEYLIRITTSRPLRRG